MTDNRGLRQAVYELMANLPADKVTTYGDMASFTGHPGAARTVGGIAHSGPEELPWHRLVNSRGGLAIGFPGGQGAQQQLLELDGICCADYKIKDFAERRWNLL